MSIAVFPARREDIGALARLHASCFEDAWSAEAFAQLLAAPGAFALLARSESAALGFVLARVAADEAEILSVGVGPAMRGQGTAARLLAEAAARTAVAGATKLFLEVAAKNAPALALYRKLGFREVGCRRGYYRDGSGDGLTMRVDLPLAGPLAGLGNRAEFD